jgi:CHASE2 domain-containing sensor protein
VAAQPWLPWDRFFFDQNLRWRHSQLPPQHPLIAHLSLGEADLNQWSSLREEYQGLAQVVADSRDQGAAVIVVDLMLTRGKEVDLKSLWEQLYNRPDIVLARGLQETPRLPGPLQTLGVANLQRDDDGLFRRYQLFYPEAGSASLALAAYLKLQGLSTRDVHLDSQGNLEIHGDLRFPNQLYFQPRTAWSELGSQIQFARPGDLKRWKSQEDCNFEGKAVFVGYVAPGVNDVGPIVLDPGYPKVGIHATVLSNLLQQRYYQSPPRFTALLGGWAWMLVGAAISWRFSRRVHPLGLSLAALPGWFVLASHQSLWGSWLLPWVSWGLAALTALWLPWLWRQRLWKSRLLSMQAGADFQNPLMFKTLGNYLLVEKLGEGGFGAVYRAVPSQTLDASQVVAVKLASPEACANEEYRKRFLRESRICRSLDHPAIVRVLEAGEQEGLLYYTMEWLPGRTLRHWMMQTHTPQEVCALLLPLLEAIAYAHSQGVLHRDLKPENVVLGPDGPKIVDFGLAFDDQSSQLTAAQDVMGTLNYLAPERIEGVTYDACSDQYALGVMGYEMITGCSPFPESSNPGQALAWRLTQEPISLCQRLQTNSPLMATLDKMMARDPKQRYASLREAADTLRAALSADPNQTLPVS